jgi:hypothetical protein
MSVTYANSRIVLPNTCWSVITSTGGSLSPTNLYFSLQTENRIGRNLLLVSPLISITTNSKVTITINSQAKLPTEEIFNYVVGVSISSVPNTFSQITKIPVTSSTTFPLTLVISRDIFLRTGYITSDNISNILSADLLHGMRIGYNGTGLVYEYDSLDSTSIVDNQFVLSASTNKRFKARGGFSTYISSVYDIDGSRLDLREENDISPILSSYGTDGSDSPFIRLWLDNASGSVAVGTRITLTVKLNELVKTNLFDKKIRYIFEGIVDLDTCVLRTTKRDGLTPFEKLGIPLIFNSNNPNFALEEDLLIGEALSFSFYLNFLGAELNDFIPEGSIISIYPSFVSNVGSYVAGGEIIGDCIFSEEGRRRVLPSTTNTGLEILSGSGLIKNYTFPLLPKTTILGLIPNTANQKVFINNLGNCFLAPTDLPNSSAIRAIISTTSGQTSTTSWSSYISITQNSNFTLTLTLPTNIRSNYPDLIATSLTNFVIGKYVVYIQRQSNSEIRRFEVSYNSNVINNTFSISLLDWNSGVVVNSVPSATSTHLHFNLYDLPYFITSSGLGSGFSIGSYRFSIAYAYDGNQVTSISHDPAKGCILELDMPLSQALNNMKYLGEPLFKEQLTSLDTTYIPDGQRRSLKGTDSSYLDLVFYKYQTGAANNVTSFKPGMIPSTSPGIWKEKESGLSLEQVSDYVYNDIFPNISTLNEYIRSVDESMIPLILALGGGGSSSSNGTSVSSGTSSGSVEYLLVTINGASITPDLNISNKYMFNSSGTLSSINNPLNIGNGDKFTIQTSNTGVYNFGATYLLPENYTSVTLEEKSEIKATRRGTSTDIIIYSVW